MITDRRGDRFLAHVGVTGPMNQSALMAARKLLFALPNDLHRPVETKHRLAGQFVLLAVTQFA